MIATTIQARENNLKTTVRQRRDPILSKKTWVSFRGQVGQELAATPDVHPPAQTPKRTGGDGKARQSGKTSKAETMPPSVYSVHPAKERFAGSLPSLGRTSPPRNGFAPSRQVTLPQEMVATCREWLLLHQSQTETPL